MNTFTKEVLYDAYEKLSGYEYLDYNEEESALLNEATEIGEKASLICKTIDNFFNNYVDDLIKQEKLLAYKCKQGHITYGMDIEGCSCKSCDYSEDIVEDNTIHFSHVAKAPVDYFYAYVYGSFEQLDNIKKLIESKEYLFSERDRLNLQAFKLHRKRQVKSKKYESEQPQPSTMLVSPEVWKQLSEEK